MLTVKTYLRDTKKKGIGLFAEENIPSGKIVHKTDTLFNKIFSVEEIEKFTDIQKEFYEKYMIHNKDGSALLDLDNARFINHSYDPNLCTTSEACIAIRDIWKGEELTLDYTQIGDVYSEIGLDFKVYR